MNKVVARYTDGRVVKGSTVDFVAGRDVFHVIEPDAANAWDRTKVAVNELKALFYVKDLVGDAAYVEKKELRREPAPGERGVRVTFSDGEVMVGTTTLFQVSGLGFFLVPGDERSNNDRAYVPKAAAVQVAPF